MAGHLPRLPRRALPTQQRPGRRLRPEGVLHPDREGAGGGDRRRRARVHHRPTHRLQRGQQPGDRRRRRRARSGQRPNRSPPVVQHQRPANTRAHRIGNLRTFFIRIHDWDWPEAPPTVPVPFGDLPRQEKPLTKTLDDAAAAKFLRVAQARPRLLERVVCEVLIRTGLRVSELTGLRRDAVRRIGAGHWLHVPVGKLLDDRYIPLHPQLVDLIADYRHHHVDPAHPLLLPRENGTPMDRYSVTRCLNNVATAAGIGHAHPHQMRHTLTTQAINRGMSLEAIAALLGHHSMDMTLRHAKIANRTVTDEYFAVTEKVEALYAQDDSTALPASAAGPEMARLQREMHQRMLGNGFCTRPPALDCTFESVCETCTFFQTSIAFRPTLQAQHDHAAEHDQPARQQLFAGILGDLDESAS
ncbi:tyrosine-type recombinase/integrase [Kineococcus esterisolvens]|uniref:tyrosine-type recombinase/integrase n=1 Tax=unclassified Kineococcus TaxID=2621656 RepID=UPI003D7E26E2